MGLSPVPGFVLVDLRVNLARAVREQLIGEGLITSADERALGC
jgi:hypothetical protein